MISLTTGAAGVRARVARPPARGRIEDLRRLTAPTHGAGFWLGLWIAVAAPGFAALIRLPVAPAEPVPVHSVFHTLSGISFAACGVVAWRRRRDSAVGPLLTVAGFGVLLSTMLGQLDSPLAFTLALLFGELWIML